MLNILTVGKRTVALLLLNCSLRGQSSSLTKLCGWRALKASDWTMLSVGSAWMTIFIEAIVISALQAPYFSHKEYKFPLSTRAKLAITLYKQKHYWAPHNLCKQQSGVMPSEKCHPAGFFRIGVRHHMTAPISRLLYIQRQEAIHRKRFIYGKFSIQVIQGTLQKKP